MLAEEERGFNQVVSCDFFEDLMLILDRNQLFFITVLRQFDDLKGIYIFGLFSSNHVDFSKSSCS